MADTAHGPSPTRAWIITGPTSGIGRRTALELAKHGTVVLVGRDRAKLDDVEHLIAARGGRAVPVRDPAFQDRVVAETRALLATVPVDPAPTDL